MPSTRRLFLKSTAAAAAGFAGLKTLVHPATGLASTPEDVRYGYGPLQTDPQGMLDLPAGFRYQIISQEGQEMNDGLLVPGAPDGMAALPGPYGLTVIVRNHELEPDNTGPFGTDRVLSAKVPREKIYDAGNGATPCSGGTSTLVYDTQNQRLVRQFMSLSGTIRNCAGGPTPWKSWVTCEETMYRAGDHGRFQTEKDHGYNFEVPVTARMELADPVPLVDMGRFNHEAIAVDVPSGIVFQTEDRDDGLLYRFLPNVPGNLQKGGRLQALAVIDRPSMDMRNWGSNTDIAVGQTLKVQWIDVENVSAPNDDLRQQGFSKGAARFARGEGMWVADQREIFFACTSGGHKHLGQIWRYRPSSDEGKPGEKIAPGELELFIEPNDGQLIENADNLTVSPWGDLIVCEDRSGQVVRLVGVTPQGQCYPFALNHLRSEFAGATFSPDGSTLFVNIQVAGLTVAITGPWQHA